MKNLIFPYCCILNLLLLFYLLSSPEILFAQGKQANNWYFGIHSGITFNSDSPPQVLTNGQTQVAGAGSGVASISDEDGNLLFYSTGSQIWNRNHIIMLNGNGLGVGITQGAVIVPDPGNPDLFYFFNFGSGGINNPTFQYSVVDINMDNGMGGVVPEKRCIPLLFHASSHLGAVRHKNGTDIWVIAHKLDDNAFYAYKVTADGIESPIVSNVGSNVTNYGCYLKISPNGKKVASAQWGNDNYCEVFGFDAETGIISDENIIHILRPTSSIEFSSDNTKLYTHYTGNFFFQYDLSAGNAQSVIESEVQLTSENLKQGALQLGPDGKIYCATDTYYLGVIHEPNNQGLTCNFEHLSIYVGDDRYVGEGLPTFIQSYLNDPEYSTAQHCFGQPTQFTITTTNGIDSVFWKFKDFGNMPYDTSTSFSPLYTFSAPGTYYPELTVWSGLLPPKTVKDTVIIYPLPDPDLGKDTLFCPDATIDLNLDASPGEQFFWNSDFSPGQPPTYHVTDTGYYKVRVKDHGCSGYDTIYVGRYIEPAVNTSGIQYTAAHCGSSDGSITGIVLMINYPCELKWKDALGNEVGNYLDLINVPSGVYTLEIYYGNDCFFQSGPYTIQDIGGPQITSAVPEDDHCNLGLGKITVTPETGNPGDYWYSINGSPFIQNGGVFTGLIEGNYTVMIKDQFDCQGSYPNNPVIVNNIAGPIFNNILITPENSGNGQGSITVYATGSNLTYSIENNPFQPGNAFNNLSEGDYLIQIMDEFGCLEDSTVHVDNLIGTKLFAMAGGDRKCLNALANSNIRVSNVSGVKDFTATLSYDGTRLRCINFNGTLQGIDGTVYPATSQIVLEWHGTSSIPDNDTIILGDLIFETLQSGFADVNWQDPPATVFMDEDGNIIDPSTIQFFEGIIEVNELPDAILDSVPPLCEGDTISLTPTISGGADPVTYEWSTPQGTSSTSTIISIENAMPEHSGKYSFKVSDRYHCADTADIEITVTPLPKANFPEVNDTIWYEGTFKLEAPDYYYSYEWSNGDTIWYINVTEEGLYSVQLKTKEGCQNLESVMMMDALVPISIPNAFTPNGDGLNDTFSPIVDSELVRRFHITIYNQWGQRIFESTNADKAWDGKDVMPGVYSWVISYENRIGKGFQMKGSVTLIK